MAEFGIVDLTGLDELDPALTPKRPGSAVASQGAAGRLVGHVDTSAVAAELEALRVDLTSHMNVSESGLRLSQLVIRLAISAEGGVAFVAKGGAEASIEVTFSREPIESGK